MTSPSTHSEAADRSLKAIFAALMLGMLLAALDQTIVSTALPTIVGDFGGIDHLAWVVTSYMLASTVSTPLYGKLGDMYGRKRVFEAAIVIFLLGSVLCGLARTMGELIAFRALQGIGAGGLMVGVQAIIADLVPPRDRGRYAGLMGAVFGVSSVAGPLLGGFFVDHLSWRWVFYINLPLGAVALIVCALKLHLPKRRVQHRIDYLGAALLSAAAVLIILVTTWGGDRFAWMSATILFMLGAAVVLLGLFVLQERRAAEPVMPLSLFRSGVFRVATGVGFLVGVGMFGALTFLPLFLQIVEGASPTTSGLLLLPMVAGMLLSTITSGRLISRTGRYRVFPIVGTAVMSVGMLLLSQLDVESTRVESGVFMFVVGAGLGMVMQTVVLAVQNDADPAHLGVATSTATFFRSIGGSVGAAVFGAIFSSKLADEIAQLPDAVSARVHTGAQTDPATVSALPPEVKDPFLHAFADALQHTFMWGVVFTVTAFALTWLLKEKTLRDSHGPEAKPEPGPVS